jgi:hypothetical protein
VITKGASRAVTCLAVLNGTRLIVDAGKLLPPATAERELITYVTRSAPSDAAARQAVAADGGWIGCVEHLYGRMRAKSLALRKMDRPPVASIDHTLIESARVLSAAGRALPDDDSLKDAIYWIIANNEVPL